MDLMEFLYRVMEELSNAGVPIVFKGAMVLNLAIMNNNPSKVERATRSNTSFILLHTLSPEIAYNLSDSILDKLAPVMDIPFTQEM